MTLRVLLASLHLLALGIGLGAVWTRARLLSARPIDVVSVRRAFVADAWWGIAAGLWIATGLWRLFGHGARHRWVTSAARGPIRTPMR